MAATPLGKVLRQLQGLAATPDPHAASDRALLERFRADNDQAAFASLVRQHGGMVWNVCRHVLGQEQDAEDAFQATFLGFIRLMRALFHGGPGFSA